MNTTVILAHMRKTIIKEKLVVACLVDGQHAKIFKVQLMSLNRWIHENHPDCTHDNVFVLCYDTPGRNNSRVSLVYANPENKSQHFETESEHPLFVPRSVYTSRPSVMVCTTVYNSPPYFIEWLHYQRKLGVDLVYVNAQESFLDSNEFHNTFFQSLLTDGFVQLKVWQEILNKNEVFYHSQVLYYQNCLYRFQGVYDYAVMIDTDDFVISRTHKSLQESLKSIMSGKWGSIRLHWIRYYEPRCGVNFSGNLTTLNDGNLTRYVNISSAIVEKNYKSIHRLSSTIEVSVHQVGQLMLGYRWFVVPSNVIIYAVHLKKVKLSEDQLKRECKHATAKPQVVTSPHDPSTPSHIT